MARAKNEFTNVTKLQPEAVGEAGKRTFRLLADSGSSSVVLWLEKEQLFQLALAIQQVLTTIPDDRRGGGTSPADREAPGLTRLDFNVAKLVLGHDGERRLFTIDAHGHDDAEEDSATVRVWATADQVKDFSEEALRVCAAGRPLCPLCSRPLDPEGHQCPRVNGQVNADL